MPDRSETEWLDRHGVLWLKNADLTKGRKAPTSAAGFANFTGVAGTLLPIDTQLRVGTARPGHPLSHHADAAMGDGPTRCR